MEPNSQSTHKPVEGRSLIGAKKIEDKVANGEKTGQKHVENRAYLQPIRNTMHEPIEGRSEFNPALLIV